MRSAPRRTTAETHHADLEVADLKERLQAADGVIRRQSRRMKGLVQCVEHALFEMREVSSSDGGALGDHDDDAICQPDAWPTNLSETDRSLLARAFDLLSEAIS